MLVAVNVAPSDDEPRSVSTYLMPTSDGIRVLLGPKSVELVT